MTQSNRYYAYQNWQGTNGIERKVYGEGATPEDAIFNARFELRNGQPWARKNAPNASDLRTCPASEIDDAS